MRLEDYPAELADQLKELFKSDSDLISEWEANFISDLQERFEQWEEKMYISEKQADTIERIYNKVFK
jgi:hypothetical protein